ncbi:MAG: hypothetical protein AAF679_03570 [Pseudomonadota bacterium]
MPSWLTVEVFRLIATVLDLGEGYLFYPGFKGTTMVRSDMATVGEESRSVFLESMLGERIYFAENYVGFSDFMTDLFDVRADLCDAQEEPAP